MRQLVTLKDQASAQRFAAWLVTQKIEAHAEQERDGWVIWVREEDRLAAAREHLERFKLEPDNARYRSAEQQAAAMLREEQQKREKAQRNTVDMSRQWGKGINTPRSQPLVMVFILVSIIVFALTDWGNQRGPGLLSTLQFSGGRVALAANPPARTYVWKDIAGGEVWRLITPMFIHFGLMHLAFNLMAVYDFGGQIENRLKSGWFLLLVIAIAIVSNVAQVLVDSFLEHPYFPEVGNFGGMSGVNYGLFGYVFVRSRIMHDSTYLLRPETSLIMVIWLVLCIGRNFAGENFGGGMSYVANSAHMAGMLAGMAIAYAPRLLRFSSRA